MLKIQTLIKPIIESLYLKPLPQALNSTSLIMVKLLEMCLLCPLVQKIAMSFCDEIEITSISLLSCLL